MDSQNQDFRSLTLRQMAYAVAAADVGNVTEAGRRLGVSQPSISTALAGLEAHYGQPLFVRLPGQGVQPTGFGADVLRQMKVILEQVDQTSAMARPQPTETGVVTLACYDALAPYLLPGLLRRLRTSMPGLTVRFTEASLDGVSDSVMRETAEFGVTYDLGAPDEIVVRTVYQLQPRVICAADHAFASRPSVALSELHDEHLILLDQPMSAQYVLGLLRASGATPTVTARVKGFELQRAFVANGLGVAVTHTIPHASTSYDGLPIKSVAISDDLPAQRVLLIRQKRQSARAIIARAESEILKALRAD